MDNFDLKKYLAGNRLNEGVGSNQGSVIETLKNSFYSYAQPRGLNDDQWLIDEQDLTKIFEQAKAKEIENIKNAFNYGQTDLGMEADEYLDFINFK